MIGDIAWLVCEEEDLVELLKYLPKDNYMRERIQKAGENIFRW
jgi:hypothetical protein